MLKAFSAAFLFGVLGCLLAARGDEVFSTNNTLLNPPPISLHLTNASADEAVEALSKTIGVPLSFPRAYMSSGRGGPVREAPMAVGEIPHLQAQMMTFPPNEAPEEMPIFTLDADNEPFWDVLAKLSRQGFVFERMVPRSAIPTPVTFGPYEKMGGFAAFPLKLQRMVDLQADPHSKPQFWMAFGVAFDPRIPVLQAWKPRLTEITDEGGHELTLDRPPANWGRPDTFYATAWQLNWLAFHAGGATPRTINVKGEGRFSIRTGGGTTDLRNPQGSVGQTIKAGNTILKVESYKEAASSVMCQFRRVNAADAAEPLKGTVTAHSSTGHVNAPLVDGQGISINLPSSFGAARPRVPISTWLTIEVVTESKEVVVPFELKNIPVP